MSLYKKLNVSLLILAPPIRCCKKRSFIVIGIQMINLQFYVKLKEKLINVCVILSFDCESYTV